MDKRREVKLLTFASNDFLIQQTSLNKSAAANGVTALAAWTETELKATEFYGAHSDILAAPRGCGYWLWKPYLIRLELGSLKNGDFLVYYDVGRPWLPHRITQPLSPLLDWCERENAGILPGVYIPEVGRNREWTKRECFVLMGCDEPRYWEHPQVQATYSVWQKSPHAEELLDDWLRWCTTPGVLSDEIALPQVRNFPDFIDHRHDQSVMTNLVIQKGLRCYGNPDVALPGSKDIDNLIDRIQGRELSLRCRVLGRKLRRRILPRYLKFRQRLSSLAHHKSRS